MWNKDTPLWMPPGSVRSILALAVLAGYLFGVVDDQITTLVLGSYFVGRAAASNGGG